MLLHRSSQMNQNEISLFSNDQLRIKSLSMRQTVNDSTKTNSPAFSCAKVPLCASLTVESAFVLPLFMLAALVFLGLFPAIQVETKVNEALQYAARTQAVAYAAQAPFAQRFRRDDETGASKTDTGIASVLKKGAMRAAGKGIVAAQLKKNGCWTEYIRGGPAAITFAGSEFEGEYVDLVASYQIRLPISFWKIKSLPVRQRVRVRKWTGCTGEGEDSQKGWVFITPRGDAYHSTTQCRMLDLTIRQVDLSQIRHLRSADGRIYYPCSCVRHKTGTVYVTDYGQEYHESLSCGDLKRTVTKVRESETGHRHPCAYCCR